MAFGLWSDLFAGTDGQRARGQLTGMVPFRWGVQDLRAMAYTLLMDLALGRWVRHRNLFPTKGRIDGKDEEDEQPWSL